MAERKLEYNFRFLDWQVYKDSKKLHTLVLQYVKKLPYEYRSSLGDQILRSSLSVALNIAEGTGKESGKDLKKYMYIASGSLTETLANADIMKDNKLISEKEFQQFYDLVEIVARQLGALRKKLV